MTWPIATLDDLKSEEPRSITDGPFGSNLASRHYTDHGPRVVRLQNIGDGRFEDARAHISQEHFESLRAHEVRPGDLLVASLGEVLPRACLAPTWLGPAIVKADCIRVRLGDRVDSRWVLYAMQRPDVRRWADEHRHGVGRPRLGLKTIREIPVPLPPLDQQRQIVDILEDHLSRLDAAVESLRTSLRRADAMVVSSLAAQVTTGSERWLASTVGQQAEVIQYGSGAKCGTGDAEDDVPVLRMGNVKDGALVWGSLKYLPHTHEDFPKLLLKPGDLLFNRTNSAAHVGKSAVFDLDCAASFASYLIRVRFGPDVLPAWASMVINSPVGREYVTSVVSQQVGQANVNGKKLKAFPLPLPSREEQDRRVGRHARIVESRERLRDAIDTAATRAAGLRRSLLAAAFSGRLTGSGSDLSVAEEMNGA